MSETQKNDRKERELGALWEKTYTDKNGTERTYYTGSIDVKKLASSGQTNLFVEENAFKTEEKHPSLRVYIDRPKTNQKGGGQGNQSKSSDGNNPFGDDVL